MTARNVTVHIRATTTQYKRAVTSANKATAGLSKTIFSLKNVAVGAAAGAAVGLGLIGAAAIKVGIDSAKAFAQFEKSLAQIEGLVGVSKTALDGMVGGLKELAVETARGPQELAEALFFITSAGLEGEAAMEALEVSAKAAAAGLGDTATIADVVTSAVNAYGDSMDGASVATDVLVATVREGKAEAPALASALGRVIPIASQMGISFDQVGASVAAMTRVGLDANEATTALRNVMTSLLNPTTSAEAALQDLGLSAAGLRRQIREEGLFQTLQTLTTAFDGNAEATSSVFGNVRALTGVLSLMGSNAAATEEIFNELAVSTGALDEAFGVAADTGAFQFEQAKARIEVALLDVGEEILPKLADAVDQIAPHVGELVGAFGDLAIIMTNIGVAVIPPIADFLSNTPQYVRGVQKLALAYASFADGFNAPFVAIGILPDIYDDADAAAAAFLNTQIKVHNAMRDGHDAYAIAFTGIKDLADQNIVTSGTLDGLQTQLGLTDREMAAVTGAFAAQATELRVLDSAIIPLRDKTDELTQSFLFEGSAIGGTSETLTVFEASLGKVNTATSGAGDAIGGMVLPLHEVRDALLAAEDAQQSLADAMLAMANPTFKAVKAVDALKKAQANAIKVQADSKSSAEDIAAAQLAVVEQTLKAQGALDALGFDKSNLEASLQSIEQVLGVGRDEALKLLETLGILDGTQVAMLLELKTKVTGPLSGALNGVGPTFDLNGAEARAGGGPVSAGVPYRVGEQGEELFVPERNGTIIPNNVLNQTSSSSRNVELNIYGTDTPGQDAESLLMLASVGG